MRCLQQEIAGYVLGALSPSRPERYARLGWVRRQAPDDEEHATPVRRLDEVKAAKDLVLCYALGCSG